MNTRQILRPAHAWATAAAFAAGMLASSAAFAAPIDLPAGTPLFIQFTDAEQFSASNSITGGFSALGTNVTAGMTEGNWGIVQISNVVTGTVLNPGVDIQGGGAPIFVDQLLPSATTQILGIFYGINNTAVGTPTTSVGGVLDLYWWENNPAGIQNTGTELASAANLAKRTAQDSYTGFTCAGGNTANCTLLAQFLFVPGSGAPTDTTSTITSPQNPSNGDGTSKSYLIVDTSVIGAWTSALNTDWFTIAPGGATFASYGLANPDVRLDNNFTFGVGNWSVAGTDIVGLRSNDPARTFTRVPEPASLAMFGTALLGLGLWAGATRRKQQKL